MTKGYWFWGGYPLNETLLFLENLGVDSIWAWGCDRTQVNDFLNLGYNVYVVAGSGNQVDTGTVEEFKDLPVIFVVDDWVGGGEPLNVFKTVAPERQVGVSVYGVDNLVGIPSDLYDYVFGMYYPVLHSGFELYQWFWRMSDLNLYSGKPFYAWIQTFSDAQRRMSTVEELSWLLWAAQMWDGAFVFLPKIVPGLDSINGSLEEHPELWSVVQAYPNIPRPGSMPVEPRRGYGVNSVALATALLGSVGLYGRRLR